MYILYYINFFRYNRTVSIFWNFLSGYTSIVLQKLNAMFLKYILWYLDFGRKQPHVQALLSPLQLDFLRNLDVVSEDHLRFCWCIFYFFHKIMWFCGDISNTTFAFFERVARQGIICLIQISSSISIGTSFWWILSFFKLTFQSVSSKLV